MSVVDPMTAEEEESLLEEQEKNRTAMLESVFSVPLGRRRLMGPLENMAAGDTVNVSILDGNYWNISGGALPECRRGELWSVISGMCGHYLNRDAVRRLHPMWHLVEDLGRDIFSGMEEYRDLILQRSRAVTLLDKSAESLEMLSTCYDLLEADRSGIITTAWRLHPILGSIQNSLEMLEERIGTGLPEYSDAGKRFSEALKRMRNIIERFVEANLSLVISRVRLLHPCDVMEEMDLVQEGCQGLMEAVRRYDPSRGCKLSTFAVWWIRSYVMKAMIRHGRLVRVPVRIHYEDFCVRRAVDEFALEHRRPPALEELADFMGRDRSELEEIYMSTAPPLSLDHTDSDTDATIADFLESRLQLPDTRALNSDLRGRLRIALASLSDREKTIITLRFGLIDDEPCTLAQLGRVFGISRERVRQIERRALEKLANHGLLSTLDADGV